MVFDPFTRQQRQNWQFSAHLNRLILWKNKMPKKKQFTNQIFRKQSDFEFTFFQNASGFETRIFKGARLWTKGFPTRLNLTWDFHSVSVFETTFLQCVSFWINFFTTRPLFNRENKNVSVFQPTFYNSSTFELRFLPRLRLWLNFSPPVSFRVENITTYQTLK